VGPSQKPLLLPWCPKLVKGLVGRGQEFENFSKNAVFLVSSSEKQISPLLAPLELLKNPLVDPRGKNRSDVHAHKHVKSHHFYKKLCCITPSGNTVQQRQCGKQAIQGDRLCILPNNYEILPNYK